MNKLFTLNTHSHMENAGAVNRLVSGILQENPDIIALQEVNQTKTMQVLCDKEIYNYKRMGDGIVKADNYAFAVVSSLEKFGVKYYWSWLPVKVSYGRFDEGLAVLSKTPIEETDSILLSQTDDYTNWKKRMALGIKTNGQWFYSVHLGWFDDKEEPFWKQWNKLNTAVSKKDSVWLMGDFNNVAGGDGYKMILESGWFDCYKSASRKDDGFTVVKSIDGWKNATEKMRIDYIFCNKSYPIRKVCTVFNGIDRETVSDHFGVIATL